MAARWRPGSRAARLVAAVLLLLSSSLLHAEDWPQWRGHGRLAVLNEAGLIDRFPATGLTVTWRVPVHAGYSGPAVAAGRVFVTDGRRTSGSKMVERVLALDEQTGKILWSREWETNYSGLEMTFALGPRATPTVDGDLVYVLGAMGNLLALKVTDGTIAWQKNFVDDFAATIPSWGATGAPLVDGDRLITLVGGEPDAKVIAFNKRTGEELWRALSSDWEPGYAQPIIVEAGGARQLMIWHPTAISSLEPATGRVLWEVPFQVDLGMTVPTLVHSGSHLLATTFYNGARMLKLDEHKPGATLLWRGDSFAPHSIISTPIVQGDYIYGMSQGQLQCWELATGKQVWRTRDLIPGRTTPFATAFFVRNGDRYFINTERGDLVIAQLSPQGYQEISRTHLIEPTHPYAREPQGTVHWSHPAYANRHVIVRNDKEILRASLAKD
ncbi:MAG TPA: PQQ-binding-like beta-propeller repeat protein [Vicinamibacterales bacterium]|nr:PQQ-binding-like beta-propeller repeat protein [Vicinamibacterales bacterium]